MSEYFSHGGKRHGAGRPKGSGKYKEPTKAIRVPQGSIEPIRAFLDRYPNATQLDVIHSTTTDGFEAKNQPLKIPIYSSRIAAGQPSPAEDHVEETLDLNDYMIRHPDSTYMLRVEGESMQDIGILPNDILVVDRSLPALHNKIVIAAIDGELTVKRLFHRGELIKLCPENSAYPDIEIETEADLVIWGVVIGSFRRFQSF